MKPLKFMALLSTVKSPQAVNPMAVGKTRGREQTLKVGNYADEKETASAGDNILCFQVHGDAAFSAQVNIF